MKELTVDIDDFKKRLRDSQYFIGAQESILHLLELSRVRPAAPEPEVAYGPCELRSGVWAVYDKHGTFLRYRDGLGDGPTGKNYRYVRVGDIPTAPTPKPAPPMPDGDPPKRIIARRAGDSFHGVMRDDGFIYIGPGMYHYESPRAAERTGGWEIEIVEDKAND